MNLLTVGRISPVKGLEDLLKSGYPIIVVGESTDQQYYDHLKKMYPHAIWAGKFNQKQIVAALQSCDVFVSNSHTGSLDKACLEAMSCAKLILTSNTAVKALLKHYGEGLAEMLTFEGAYDFERKLKALALIPESEKKIIGQQLREIILERHSMEVNIKRIVDELTPRKLPLR